MNEEFKKAFENAHTEEEKKAVVEKFKDEMNKLSDEDLEQVSGGTFDLPQSFNCYMPFPV